MPDVHAMLSASGANRWMKCTPSVALEAQFPDKSSSFADEGTEAHAIAELILRYNNGEITKRKFNTELKKHQENQYWNEEMQQYIESYTSQVWEVFNEVKKKCRDAEMMLEQRLDFSAWVKEGFGTGDVVIIADGTVQIIDLKYGKGVGVNAKDNPQLRLYGLGAIDTYGMLYDIEKVKMSIIQPRLDNYSTEELTVDELTKWGEEEVKPKAELAYAGKGDYCAGDHCRFCKAKAVCRARAEENMKLAEYDFKEPPVLKPSEIADILNRADKLVRWVDDVVTYALDAAYNKGVVFDGWKVVEGRSVRQYKDEAQVVECLKKQGYEDEKLYTKKLKGITDMTRLLGKAKFEELLGTLIVKPHGKPTLAPASDKRPEFKPVDAKTDFADDLLD